MVDTIKFSQMTSGGDLSNDDKTPGLKSGENVLFNNPWTFLPSGTTAERPTPSSTVNFRLRFNTDEQLYEYYDAVLGQWTQLQESAFTQGPFLIYTADSSIPDGQNLGALADGLLKQTITLGVATLDIAVNAVDYWAPGDALTRTQAPTVGDDVTNKTYVDSLVAGAVTSVQGTANQVLVNATSGTPQTGALTLTLPQDIASTSSPTFAALTLTAPLTGVNGGTGLAAYTLGDTLYASAANTLSALAGNTTAVKQYLSQTGTGAVSAAPVWATISGGDITGAALTKTDDTNVTLTLGGTPTTALLRAASLTLGWTGTLAFSRGGTNVGSVPTTASASNFAAWDASVNLPANNFLAGYATTVTAAGTTTLTVASANQQFFTGSTTQTVVMPVTSTLTLGQNFRIVNNSSGALTVNSSGGNNILTIAADSVAILTCILTSGTTAASWDYVLSDQNEGGGVTSVGTGTGLTGGPITSTGTISLDIPVVVSSGGTGLTSTTINQILYSSAANTIAGLATANNGYLKTSSGGVPSISALSGLGVDASLVKTVKSQVFNASGTYTPSTGMLYCIAEVVGSGGGGGGAAASAANNAAAGGGGGGGYARKVISAATIGASQAVTIGAGGAGGAAGNNVGSNGNTSSLGAIVTAAGGAGGQGSANAIVNINFGGTSGSGSAGDFNGFGMPGGIGIGNGGNIASGAGGASGLTGGGGQIAQNSAGNVGGANTGAGGGGAGTLTNTARAGGDGGAGIVIITEFCNQ